jgi:hypothetical protein
MISRRLLVVVDVWVEVRSRILLVLFSGSDLDFQAEPALKLAKPANPIAHHRNF